MVGGRSPACDQDGFVLLGKVQWLGTLVRKENASNGLLLITTFIPTPLLHGCIYDRYFRHLCAEINPHLNDDLSWKWISVMH